MTSIHSSHSDSNKQYKIRKETSNIKNKNSIIDIKEKKGESIPFPYLKSYLHQRQPINKITWEEQLERWQKSPQIIKIAESMLSRIFRRLKLLHPNRKWAFYKITMKIAWFYYKYVYHMELRHWDRIPEEGAIFYLNHFAETDVVLPFLAAFKKPVGVFSDVGDGLLVDLLEYLGFVPRRGNSSEMIEKMVRQIAGRNKYFAIWPEGTPDKGKGIMQGFSGIIRVYATLNSDKDRIPFVPVLMDFVGGSPRNPPIPHFHKRKKRKIKNRNKNRKTKQRKVRKQIVLTMFPKIYLPRDWLKPPEQGGKTPREMIDFLMEILSKSIGQKELAPNPVLQRRKKNPSIPWK